MPKFQTESPRALLSRRDALIALLGAGACLGLASAARAGQKRADCIPLVLGLGGMGNNVALHLASAPGGDLAFAVMHRRARDLARSSIREGVVIGSSGCSRGGDARRPVPSAIVEGIRSMVEGVDVLVIVAAMNGSAGGPMAPVVGRFARQAGIHTIAAVSLPPHWEGERQLRVAKLNASALSPNVDRLVVVDQERLFDDIGVDEMTQRDFLSHSNAVLVGGIQSVLGLPQETIYQTGALSITAR